MKVRRSPFEKILLVFSVAFLTAFSVVPVLWGLSTSLKAETGIFAILGAYGFSRFGSPGATRSCGRSSSRGSSRG